MTYSFKKGLGDALTIIMFLFSLAITIVVIRTLFNAIDAIPIFRASTEMTAIMNNNLNFFNSMDWAFTITMFALNLYALIMLFFLESNPVLFVIHLLAVPLTIWVSVGVSNAYETMLSTMSGATSYTIMNYIMTHLPQLMFGFDVVGGILLLAVMTRVK